MISWAYLISKITGGLGAAVDLFARHRWARWGGAALLWTAIALGIGWTLRGSYGEPRTITQTVTDTVEVDRDIRGEETRGASRPSTLALFNPLTEIAELRVALQAETAEALRDSLRALADRTEAVTDTMILAPTGLRSFRLARPEPITVSANQVVYASFNPSTARWERRTYEVPEDRWALDVGALGIGGAVIGIAPSLGIRYESTRLSGFYGTSTGGAIYGMSLSYVF